MPDFKCYSKQVNTYQDFLKSRNIFHFRIRGKIQ